MTDKIARCSSKFPEFLCSQTREFRGPFSRASSVRVDFHERRSLKSRRAEWRTLWPRQNRPSRAERLRDLKERSSLEQVFSELVLRTDPEGTAREIADVAALRA